MVRASGKAKRRGEATQQKTMASMKRRGEATERRDLHDCHEGTISGFSSSFKKRYYGGKCCNKNDIVVFP
jgi:hypothetical protein